jgi:hypothetical protein
VHTVWLERCMQGNFVILQSKVINDII